MRDIENHYTETKKKISRAHHLSKPCAGNTIVVRDPDGNWVFEIYLPMRTRREWAVEPE